MDYKVIDIEGVGPKFAEKLKAVGIEKASQLLEKCAKPAGRKALSEQADIADHLILKWANHCDLFRIKGVGPQFAELLEAAGVDTVKELSHRVPANLVKKLEEVNDERHLTRRVPSEKEVAAMVDQAKELKPVMSY